MILPSIEDAQTLETNMVTADPPTICPQSNLSFWLEMWLRLFLFSFFLSLLFSRKIKKGSQETRVWVL